MSTNYKKTLLLTGAGFSANFGAPLARGVWSKILNNSKIEKLLEVKKILKNNFDFEQIYSDVIRSGSFSKEEKELFQEIILDAYEDMDITLTKFRNSGFNQYTTSWSSVAGFLGSFSGKSGEVGIHFTLNQDLLIERAVQRHPLGMSAAQANYRSYWDSVTQGSLNPKNPIRLPDSAQLEEYKTKYLPSVGQMYYVKLHGSYGWQSYTGNSQMVIGKNKVEDIDKEPLLKWYFDIFKNALCQNGAKLFVVGYSFRDQHINDCLIKAIEENNLKIYVISPEDPEKLKDRLEGKPENYQGGSYEVNSRNLKIWDAIENYFPYNLGDIFPRDDHTQTQVAKDIENILNQCSIF